LVVFHPKDDSGIHIVLIDLHQSRGVSLYDGR
jgi:hypothetical protein